MSAGERKNDVNQDAVNVVNSAGDNQALDSFVAARLAAAFSHNHRSFHVETEKVLSH